MKLEHWQTGIAAALDGYDGLRPIVPSDGLGIHLRNSVGARVGVLRERFPVLLEVLGRRYFSALASRYVALHPSGAPDLDQYGSTFPAWLGAESHRRAELSEMPYLADLAALEQAWARACRAPMAPSDAAPALTSVAQADAVRPSLNPTLTWIGTRYDIIGLWNNHRLQRANNAFEITVEMRHLAIFRFPGHEPRVEDIDEPLLAVLAAIEAGATLGVLARQWPAASLAECVRRGYVTGWAAG